MIQVQMPLIEIPEHGWSGTYKKVELRHRHRDLISQLFELAELLGCDFNSAALRVLQTSTRRVIEEERGVNSRLAMPFSSVQPSHPSPPPASNFVPVEPISQPSPSSSNARSGADLI